MNGGVIGAIVAHVLHTSRLSAGCDTPPVSLSLWEAVKIYLTVCAQVLGALLAIFAVFVILWNVL
jgi:hypothetical protein